MKKEEPVQVRPELAQQAPLKPVHAERKKEYEAPQQITTKKRPDNNTFSNKNIEKQEENPKPFSSKISDIKYNDEYDIPAFLRKKMDKGGKL